MSTLQNSLRCPPKLSQNKCVPNSPQFSTVVLNVRILRPPSTWVRSAPQACSPDDAEINVPRIGTIGHVAHGKSTVVKAISGVMTVRFKNELVRNITIKLGYANAKVRTSCLSLSPILIHFSCRRSPSIATIHFQPLLHSIFTTNRVLCKTCRSTNAKTRPVPGLAVIGHTDLTRKTIPRASDQAAILG